MNKGNFMMKIKDISGCTVYGMFRAGFSGMFRVYNDVFDDAPAGYDIAMKKKLTREYNNICRIA